MNYKIESKHGLYKVIEKDTGHIIGIYPTSIKAQIIKTALNNGAGFDGWTPDFLLRGGITNK
jgi:hypothetical protein